MTIDLAFLRSLEAYSLALYVPMRDGAPLGHSGATAALGVDIGQMSAAELSRLPVSADLRAKLRPYAGVSGPLAARMLAREPVSLTAAEADELDQAVIGPKLSRLRDAYNAIVLPIQHEGFPAGFDDIPAAAQTVMFSVDWQYGNRMPEECPKFWRLCATQAWDAVARELDDFHDAYPTRRKKEAAYLIAAIAAIAAPA
jgi:hypothetical protein